MGFGGHFWDLLKPYSRSEGFDFLRNKRVAVDLSYWIVQHETAIKAYTRNPHLRLTFFRTVNLFSKFGAYPVFVVDGTPSPLKSHARIARFFRGSGIDLSNMPVPEEGASIERNWAFTKCVKECVELLELLGMPVLKAKGEAEALCALLNREGQVDACITADSDAFLFGAECVVKRLQPNSKEPFECYYMSDIEAGLGIKRKHLIAISLLVGNDHDLNGVQGVGLDTALRFVRSFTEDKILTRLKDIGKGISFQFQDDFKISGDLIPDLCENSSPKTKLSHCSLCGHPGSKRAHSKAACEYCNSSTTDGCVQKPLGFKCDCCSCDLDKKEKERRKNENWQTKVYQKISMVQNFPNDAILEMYLSSNQEHFGDGEPHLSWENPKTETLVDYLAYHQHWEPSYIRQRILPMLSTIFLRESASNPSKDLLYGQYEFDSIQRVKIRYGHQFYVVNWKKARPMNSPIDSVSTGEIDTEKDFIEIHDSDDSFDEPDVTQIRIDGGGLCLLTDENMELVKAALPEEVDRFLKEKELKEMKLKKKKPTSKCEATPEKSESPSSKSLQLSITKFYQQAKSENKNGSPEGGKRTVSSPNLSKSARRRLLFG